MSRLRSFSRSCIGLSAAAVLTLGLAGQAQSQSAFTGGSNSLSALHATFKGLRDAILRHYEEQRREEQRRERERQLEQLQRTVAPR